MIACMNALRRLESIRDEYGGDASARKQACLRELERARMPSAAALERLHESLCFLRAYPDDAALLERVERLLERFQRRPETARFAAQLADTGIAGTDIHYPFFAETARWLAGRFPRQLELDWEALEDASEQRVLDRLDPLVCYAETPALDELDFSLREWLARLKGPRERDGAFLVGRLTAVEGAPLLTEGWYEEIGLPLVLEAGPDTPSRTRAYLSLPGRGVSYQRGPLHRERPDLPLALRTWKPRVRVLTRRQGEGVIALAREAMVTRSRDLDAFAYGDPDDVRLLECEDGLAFAAIGLRPERRLMLEAVYGFLTLKNGVPIGYVLNSALFGSAEIAFNVFESFRGAEAARVYVWVLACVRHLFAASAFTIYPYQLGDGNEEGIQSGAWWFYQKLGFRPRAPAALALMRRELARLRRRPGQHSSAATLRALARHNMYYCLGRERRDVIGEVTLARISLAVSRTLGRRFGADREEGQARCAREAQQRLGLRSLAGWSPGERLAWSRWGPLLATLGGLERWTPAEKRAAVAVVRAKGGQRESDFVRRFDAHPRLRRALLRLARG